MNTFVDTLMSGHESKFHQTTKSIDRESQLYLDHLYRLRSTLTLSQTRDSILTFLIGGFDTTGTAISIVLLLLAMHQEAQEKVFEELCGIFDPDRDDISEEDLVKMTYLEMVIKESLRLIPVVLATLRTVKKDIKLSECFESGGSLHNL